MSELKHNFDLVFIEEVGIFHNIPELQPSNLLQENLIDNVPLAISIGTEKARSELIVAPVLVALRKHFQKQISLFSGIEFNIEPEKGLIGVCDFLISLSAEQLFVQAPVITLVEAKNDNLKSGLAQCLGEMLAAQIFNQRGQNQIEIVYGVVTTGTVWQFLSLNAQTVKIDLEEYSLNNISVILGILASWL
ncbi:MAG: hypothetical protein KA716_16620 [Gloeotrichia echinulata DEX184]|nr:hypothetical protein [Gloeotrichia echinulata DEX184]